MPKAAAKPCPVYPSLEFYRKWGQKIVDAQKKHGCDTKTALERVRWKGSPYAGYKCRQFVEGGLLKSLSQIKNFDLAQPALSWQHIVVLLKVEESERLSLIKDAIKKRWSSKRLRQEIKMKQPARGKSGRKFESVSEPADVWRGLKGQVQRPLRYVEWVLNEIKLHADWEFSKAERKTLVGLQTALTEVAAISARDTTASS